MASPIQFHCPNCQRSMSAPATAVGKKVRCKSCEEVFIVPDEDDPPSQPAKPAKAMAKPVEGGPKPLPPEFQKPAKAKAKAKPASETPPATAEASKPAAAPIGFLNEEDDEGPPQALNVIKEDEQPRCPHCAKELDPPDTKVCLNCGYDLLIRKRHQSKKVYQHTTEEYFMWWLPAFAWIFVMLLVLGVEIWCLLRMTTFVENNLDFLVKDEKNETTQKAQYYLSPDCFTTCFSVITLFVLISGIRFTYKRLVVNWRPPEVEKK